MPPATAAAAAVAEPGPRCVMLVDDEIAYIDLLDIKPSAPAPAMPVAPAAGK